MQQLYGLISDNGDGSYSIHWYTNKNLVDFLLLHDDESYYCNEESPTILTFPDNFNLNTLGVYISNETIEEYTESYEPNI